MEYILSSLFYGRYFRRRIPANAVDSILKHDQTLYEDFEIIFAKLMNKVLKYLPNELVKRSQKDRKCMGYYCQAF